MVRDISPDEVKLHSSEKDCWIIIHDKVYDVGKYLNDHPGGVEIVSDLAGQDATADYDDVGHTQEAHEILEKFLIGHVKPGVPVSGGAPSTPAPTVAQKKEEVKPTPIVAKPTVSEPTKPKAPVPEEDNTMILVVGAVAVIAAGFLLYKRTLKA